MSKIVSQIPSHLLNYLTEMSGSEFNPYQHLSAEEAVEYKPDLVIPTTYSSNRDPFGGLRLSYLSSAVIQTAIAMRAGTEAEFLIAGEYSFRATNRHTGEPLPSTGDLMGEVVAKADPDARLHVVHDYGGKELNNTPRQILGIREHLKQENLSSIPLVLAFGYHIPRIFIHAKAMGVPLLATSVEDMYELPEMKDSFDASQQAKIELALSVLPAFAEREKYARATSYIDRRGWLLNFGLLLQGPRLHDADPITGKAIIDTTRKEDKRLWSAAQEEAETLNQAA